MKRRWLYLTIGVTINIINGSIMSMSLFIPYIQQHFNLDTVAPIVLFSTISGLASTIFLTPMGFLYDKYGHRLLLTLSSLCLFTSGLIVNFMAVQSSWDVARIFWYSIGFINGLGFSATVASLMPTIMKWFPDKPSIASSILMASSNIAMAIWPLLIVRLITHIGVFRSYQFILFLSSITMFVGGSIFLSSPSSIDMKSTNINRNIQSFHIDKTFILLFVAMFSIALSSNIILQLLAPILTEGLVLSGIDEQVSRNILVPQIMSISGILQTFSALAWGLIANRIGVWIPLLSIYSIEGFSMSLLFYLYGRDEMFLMLLVILRFIAFSGEPAVHWATIPTIYGFESIGKIASTLNTSVMLSSVIGPTIGGIIRDITGAYRYVVLVSSLFSFTALLPLIIILLRLRGNYRDS